jgi:hypothetical protein
MGVTQTSGSVIAQPGQQFSLSSLFTLGSGLPATIGVAILDDDNYTQSNPGGLGYFSGNGTTSQVSVTTNQQKVFTYELFQYDPSTGEYVNPTLGSLNNLVYVAPTGNDHAELLSVFSFKSGTSFNYDNLTDLGDLSVVTQTSFVNPFAGAMAGQATPDEICAIAESFVGKVWNNTGCQILGNVIAGLAGSSLPFTAVALISPNENPILAQPNGEWIVAYDGRTQTDPSYAAVEAMIRPGDIVNIAWKNISQSDGHLFTVVSGSGANALVVDNEDTGANSAYDGSSSDIIIQPPHSLDETLNQYYIDNGGAVPASIEVYRLDTPIVTAQAAQATLADGSHLALSSLFTASDPVGKAVVSYQVYDSAAGNQFLVGGTLETAHSAATAITVGTLGAISLVGGTSSGGDTLEIRGFNGSYWGDWQALSVTGTPALTAAQAIADAAAGQLEAGSVVVDSAQNVVASLDALANLAAKSGLAAITLTDSGTPNLAITAAQLSADATALNEISGDCTVAVSAGSSSIDITGLSNHATTVEVSQDASAYGIAAGHGTVTVSGGGVADQFSNVTAIQFADMTEIVAAAPGQASAVTTGNIAELYSAVLAREPDLAGLTFYQSYLQQNPTTTLQQFAGWFLSSPEYTSSHAYANDAAGDTQFITDSYQNLLHRTPSAAEVAYYVTHVMTPAEGGLTPGTQAFATAQFQAHALMLVYFSASPEFLSDVQVTATSPASAQHWLILT